MKKEFIFTVSPSHSILMMASGFLFLMIGKYCQEISDTTIIQIIGLLNMLLGFVSILFGFIAILKINPKLVVNDLGIKDSRITKGFIDWSEIENVNLTYENNQNILLVSLNKEIESSRFSILNKLTKSKKNIDNISLKIMLSPLNVNYAGLISLLKENNIYH